MSICAIDDDPSKKFCSTEKEISVLQQFLKNSGRTDIPNDVESLIEESKKILGVDEESDIYESPRFKKSIEMGGTISQKIINKIFKVIGPANSTDLINNFNIDNLLTQFSLNSEEKFNKKFYPIKYQMIDFEEQKTELATLDVWDDIIMHGYDCFGVVINTDVSSGGGKHWFCLYGDFSGNGTKESPYALEYFNSSGNHPPSEITAWLEKTRVNLLKNHHKYVDIITAENRRVQYSQTECGVWSLVYIINRLKNRPPNRFSIAKIDDENMTTKCRSYLFKL